MASDCYQRDCVVQFLIGLHDSYSNMRDQVMMIEPLLAVNKVFYYVQQQKRQRQLLSNIHNLENVALFTRRNRGSSTSIKLSSSFKKYKLYCTHCKITGHSLKTCFKVGRIYFRSLLQATQVPTQPQVL